MTGKAHAEADSRVHEEGVVAIATLRRELHAGMRDLRMTMRAGLDRSGQTFAADAHQTMTAVRHEVSEMVGRINRAARGFEVHALNLAHLRRRLYLGMGGMLLLSLAGVVLVYQALYGHYRQEYERLLGEVAYLKAVNGADVAPCGDGRLCARIDGAAPPLGGDGQYRLVLPRP
ncbi:hypothetical protein HBF26_06215 [Luteibacter jiangsuensis]|uniref:Relaxation protein n=1 Tax=Luteibacter jiangsuensis TaxID=637577 RepID=A0ABX0Q3Z4_9GAMM|nr:hypothetical protein [Luteibacter jiangsuensis]NID04471.1 hypothetical protein [Luteibacter jiangsuensis]